MLHEASTENSSYLQVVYFCKDDGFQNVGNMSVTCILHKKKTGREIGLSVIIKRCESVHGKGIN